MQLVLGRGLPIEVEVHFAFGLDRELGKLPVSQNVVLGFFFSLPTSAFTTALIVPSPPPAMTPRQRRWLL